MPILPPQLGGGRVARLGPDGQRQPRVAGHRHRPVELDLHLDLFAEFVRVTPSRGGDEGDSRYPRRRDQAAVHLAAAVGAYLRVRQIGSGHAVGGLDRSAAEHQRVGRDADAVSIPVTRLHGIFEEQKVTTPTVESRVPRAGSDGQRDLGVAGRPYRSVEVDSQLNRLAEFVGVASRRGGNEGDALHHRDRDQAAVHLAAAPRGLSRMRRVGGGRAVHGRDGAAAEGQPVGRDADAVLITVTHLHRVAELQKQAVPPRHGVGRLPRLRSDVQRQHRTAGHGHRPVKLDQELDRFPQFVSVSPCRVGEVDALHHRW